MKIKNAFSVAEILVTVAVLGVIAMLVLNVVNGQDNLQKEFVRRYEMSVPKLTDIAQFAAQNADTYEDWWADSNALSGLDCEADNHSDCLKRAFLSVSPQLEDCTTDDCKLILSDDDLKVVKKILGTGSSYGINVNNLAHVKMSTGATLGLLYYDAECNTELKSNNDTSNRMVAKSCGVIFIDVNGNEPPNKFPTISDDENGTVTVTDPFSDRFMVAITKNSVEHTGLLDISVNCADGMTYDTTLKACIIPNSCSVDTAAQEYSEKVKDANDSNPELITLVYPDGEDKTGCYVVRCRTGAPPSKTHTCPTPCPVGQVLEGGIYLSNGGVIEDFEWSKKMCCTPVNNQTDLNNIRNNLSDTYCLMADIDFDPNGAGVSTDASRSWIPIGTDSTPFTGKFYGNGHKISGLKISKESACGGSHGGSCKNTNVGLFAATNGALISDLELENIDYSFEGNANIVRVGGITGQAALEKDTTTIKISNTTIKNVVVSGTISSAAISATKVYVGGLSGETGDVQNSVSNVNIDLQSIPVKAYVGGITGHTGKNKKVINNGSISIKRTSSDPTHTGGICGYCEVENSINNGNIAVSGNLGLDGTTYSGGIIGYGYDKKISNVVNNGSLSITTPAAKNWKGDIVGAMAPGSGNSGAGTLENIYSPILEESTDKSSAYGTLGKSGISITKNSKLVVPFKIYMDSRSSSPMSGHYDVLNKQNVLIPDDGTYSIWAYKTPAAGAELNPVDTLVLRWQCKPYKEDGFDCCRPSYANWEPDLPECPAP